MTNYYEKVLKIAPDNLIAYWPMWEAAGSVAEDIKNDYNGAYTGVTLGQVGIGDGRTSASFDGATSYNNIYSASFNTAFSGAAGSIMLWAKVSGVGVWTDGIARYVIRLSVDANNYITLVKSTVNNVILLTYSANAVVEQCTIGGLTTTGWMQLAITWSKAAEEVNYYMDGAFVETDITLGVWAGNLGATTTVIGAGNVTPVSCWDGYLAHAAIWNKVLTVTEIAQLYAIRSVVLDTA